MGRLSIEVSERQHQQIKAMAALRGVSIKDFILECTLAKETTGEDMTEAGALARLEALLAPRIAAAERGEVSNKSVSDVAALARSRRKA